MNVTDVAVARDALTLIWSDGRRSELPSIWLRDNCPSGFHAQTGERVFDLLSVEDAPIIDAAALEGPTLRIAWRDGHRSRFSGDWLAAYEPGRRAEDPADIDPVLWPEQMGPDTLPRHDAAAILASDAALLAWLRETAALGVSIVEGLADEIDAGVAVAERVGFLRRTNFGQTFEVVSKADPNNLAYTADALPLHTDLANQELPPGYQFLHCLANEAAGGGSVFADGFALAERVRAEDPDAFEALATTAIPFRFFDHETDIRTHSPVIVRDPAGRTREIRYNAHLAAIFDMPAERMAAYYRAYRKFMALTRDPARRLTLRLRAGEMVVFDNRRALHGREAFNPSTGFRRLHGCYVDRGEFASRLRVLARKT